MRMHGGGGGGARMIYKKCWGETYWCSVDEEEGGAVGRDAVEDDTVEREGDAVEVASWLGFRMCGGEWLARVRACRG